MVTGRQHMSAASGKGLAWYLAGLLIAVGTTAARAQPDTSVTEPDPPARVGRISLLSGPVTFTDFRNDEEFAAVLNWPMTSQQRLGTGRHGRAEVRIGSTSLRLDGDTVVDFIRIDDDAIQFTVQRGTVALRLRNREKLRELDVSTPRERIRFEDVGRYRIDVDRTPGITAITAFVGAARVSNDRMSFVIHSGQRGEVSVAPSLGFQLVAPATDVFDDWVAQRDRRDDSLRSTRYVSAEMTGVESLDEYGEWRTVETYGDVWFPSAVPVGWVPYRFGRWAYIPPWGWTWIDDAPWGFAPFHYGRWVYIRGAWAWVPGPYVARPCYAPALVAWYGSPGVSVSVIVGSVGWFPLGPGEIYVPGYRHSQRYITYVNYGIVTNVTVVTRQPSYRYRQPNFSTWAPADAIVRRRPVQRVIQAAPNEWVKLPTAPQPPIKVSGEGRKFKTRLDEVANPTGRTGDSVPPRVEVPPRGVPGRERGLENDTPQDKRPPRSRYPGDDRTREPVSRPPRLDPPRPIPPRMDAPSTDATVARPPKVAPVEVAPSPPTGHVGAPPRQFAPRVPAETHVGGPGARGDPPVQPIAPPRREPSDEAVPRAKPAPRDRAAVQ